MIQLSLLAIYQTLASGTTLINSRVLHLVGLLVVETVDTIVGMEVEVGVNLKLEHMTLYVFSSENWGRPSKEVDYLMNLLIEMVVKEIPDLMAKNVKLTVIGNMNR